MLMLPARPVLRIVRMTRGARITRRGSYQNFRRNGRRGSPGRPISSRNGGGDCSESLLEREQAPDVLLGATA
jgi:hypothetical protein